MVGPPETPDAPRRDDDVAAARSARDRTDGAAPVDTVAVGAAIGATHVAATDATDATDIATDVTGAATDVATDHARDPRHGRFGGARILIVGCGDVGLRLVAALRGRARLFATTHSPDRLAVLRKAGAVPLVVDLDAPASLHRLGGIAPVVVHLAPPPPHGVGDPRTGALLSALHGVERFVYVSTSGVYGDVRGAWIDETRTVAPQTDRARRRVDAERRLRAWARERGVRLSIVRVPGIYADDRLPTARVAAGTPALLPADDVFTNHIHADDLARVLVAAICRGGAQRVYHAVDDSGLRMGEWLDRVADARGLPRPPRVARSEIAAVVTPAMLTFLSESRRLSNARMRSELGVALRYPMVDAGLAAPSALPARRPPPAAAR